MRVSAHFNGQGGGNVKLVAETESEELILARLKETKPVVDDPTFHQWRGGVNSGRLKTLTIDMPVVREADA